MTIKTSPLKWHGGKSYLAAWLRSLAPPSVHEDPEHGYTHRNIAYAGGMAEFWNWEPVEGISETVNDLDEELDNFWFVLQNADHFSKLFRRLECTPLSEPEWSAARNFLEDYELDESAIEHRAFCFFVRYRQSRQGLGENYATPTTRTRRGMNENVSAWLSAVEGLPECHERLIRVEICNMPAIDFIRQRDHARALFYLDPPYLHETRHGNGKNSEYRHEMSERAHAILLALLSTAFFDFLDRKQFEALSGDESFNDFMDAMDWTPSGRFMLSGYCTAMYDSVARHSGWSRHEKQIDNKASGKKTKPKKTECVWTNYEHDQ